MADSDNQALLQFVYQIPVGVAQLAPDGALGMSNPAAMQIIMQVSPGTMNIFEMLAGYAPEVEHIIRGFTAHRGTILEDYRVDFGSRQTAAVHPLVVAFTVLRLGPERMMVVMHDVSKSVNAERAAKKAELQLKAVSEQVRDYGVFTFDDSRGVIDSWSASAEHLFGISEAEALGRPLEGLSRDVRLSGLELFKRAGRLGFATFEGLWARGSRSAFWGTISATVTDLPVPEGRHFACVIRDQSDALARVEGNEVELEPTTGTLRSECFMKHAAALLASWREKPRPISVVRVAVDHHDAVIANQRGANQDDITRLVVATIRTQIHRTDLIVHQGPLSFLVVMDGVDVGTARNAAEAMRAVQEQRFVEGPDDLKKITLSLGVTAFGGRDEDLGDAIERANAAVETAQARGHNQVVVLHPKERPAVAS